ncbi:CoA pyrophosphatase [Niveibacterium terrae]|uniref:CoA pyrophosphatase n=1 Tax=Niveibacterium terrae TaxID=3373598 RepID=UPI003A92D36A
MSRAGSNAGAGHSVERLRALFAEGEFPPAAAFVRPDLAPAAVLVPLVLREEGLSVLLTRRSRHLNHHPGQISFPGGRIDEADASPEAAALREASEEIALPASRVEVLGRLPDFPVGTGFLISPVVGLVRPPLDLRASPAEVDEIFEAPLSFLLNQGNHQRHAFPGEKRHYWSIPWKHYAIWGATAGILRGLSEALAQRENFR